MGQRNNDVEEAAVLLGRIGGAPACGLDALSSQPVELRRVLAA